jgi:hypothetical protein
VGQIAAERQRAVRPEDRVPLQAEVVQQRVDAVGEVVERVAELVDAGNVRVAEAGGSRGR